MTDERLGQILAAMRSKRVAVVGDFFLDKYLEFDPGLAEISIETGKVANQVVGVRHAPGAAGSVVSNLVSLGASVIAVGFTGDDGEGYELRMDLRRLGCRTDRLLTSPTGRTPTYLKPCDVNRPGLDGEAERYDTKNRSPIPAELEAELIDAMRAAARETDAVIVADQVVEPEVGVITSAMREALAVEACSLPAKVFFADSRCRIGEFRGLSIKPNQFEAVAAVCGSGVAPCDENLAIAGRELQARTGKPVFVTRSERGILVFAGGAPVTVPAVDVPEPTDPTGAGDSATAGAVLSLASGATPAEAALVANLVASITVQQLGVTGVARPEQLGPRLALWRAEHA